MCIENENKIDYSKLLYTNKELKKFYDEKIKYLSRMDSLTGLHNREYFEQVLKDMDIESNLPIAVIMGDLNGLKMINDIFGHQEGDKILKTTGKIISEYCKAGDVVARWDGDEFVLLMKNTCENKAEKICKSIKDKCSEVSVNLHHFSISLGYDVKKKSQEDIMGVLKQADDFMYNNKLLESKSLRSSIITSMQRTLYEISHETEEHAERLSEICYKIGQRMNLSINKLSELQLLAILHDIGKVAIRHDILNKPGKLSCEEWIEMKKHPQIGCRIAQSIPELANIGEYILYHHERWDGKGYPEGLCGNNIPLLSRIISVADAYDAMTNDRTYRKALSKEIAIAEIRKNSSKQFDPEIVDIFISILLEN